MAYGQDEVTKIEENCKVQFNIRKSAYVKKGKEFITNKLKNE